MLNINLDRAFAALADPTRRSIIARLASGEATVNELAAPFDVSLPAISRHLKVLEQASLIIRLRDGQHRRCRLNATGLRGATEWLEFYRQFWNESFDRLAAHLRRSGKARARRNKENPHGRRTR